MKNLNNFISEEGKKKSDIHVSDDKGADDKKYVAMMGEYKQLRKRDRDEANKLLEKIFKLAKEGDVSKKAMIGAAYL